MLTKVILPSERALDVNSGRSGDFNFLQSWIKSEVKLHLRCNNCNILRGIGDRVDGMLCHLHKCMVKSDELGEQKDLDCFL